MTPARRESRPAKIRGGQSPWGRSLAGILLFLLGLASLGFVVWSLSRDLAVWVFGRHALGEVIDLEAEQIGDRTEGELSFRYLVHYRFATASGEVVSDVSSLGLQEWASLSEGGPIDIVYFPLYPAHNRLEESRLVPILACAYLPLLIVAWIGLGSGWYLLQPMVAEPWWFGMVRREDR